MGHVQVERVESALHNQNCYLVYDKNGDAAIVDPGGNAPLLVDTIRRLQIAPRAILNTHGHPDHIGAVGSLQRAFSVPFYLHSADTKVLKAAIVYHQIVQRTPNFAAPRLDASLDGLETVTVGSLAIAVLHTPGHTPGSVCFAIDGKLFSGDTLLPGAAGRVDLAGGNTDQLRVSLRRLAALPDETVLFAGHGAPSTIAAELAHNAALRAAFSL